MEIVRLEDPRGKVWTVDVPVTSRERMRGLLGREGLAPHTGMLLRHCRSVHTVRMRFGLDVVFLDAALRVLEVRATQPGRWWVRRRGARHVMEVPLGSGLRPGDVLRPL